MCSKGTVMSVNTILKYCNSYSVYIIILIIVGIILLFINSQIIDCHNHTVA